MPTKEITMSSTIFLNLPVRDISAATRFYEAIGCKKNEQFSDRRSSSMVWSETITFQLLTHEYFATFSPKPISDAREHCGMLIALSCDSRSKVDSVVQAATVAGGASDVRKIVDMGWMYNRAFEDIDGHMFEIIWLDMQQAETAMKK
jgi:predicted lactoylglutathione lyase